MSQRYTLFRSLPSLSPNFFQNYAMKHKRKVDNMGKMKKKLDYSKQGIIHVPKMNNELNKV